MIVEANEHGIDSILLSNSLLQWGEENFRAFPWRLTRDPYKILLSEIMLHRTQAIQVVPVYERFIAKYPDLLTLAQASKGELHTSLYSLGLRWRIDLIHQMVADLSVRFNGLVPVKKEELISLPGVSEYIAGAVRCFTWNLPDALADTNTVRVIGRVFGLEVKDSSRRNKRFQELLSALLHPNEPRLYNYALLDLANKICKKTQPPDCPRCPLLPLCQYGKIRQNYKTN